MGGGLEGGGEGELEGGCVLIGGEEGGCAGDGDGEVSGGV